MQGDVTYEPFDTGVSEPDIEQPVLVSTSPAVSSGDVFANFDMGVPEESRLTVESTAAETTYSIMDKPFESFTVVEGLILLLFVVTGFLVAIGFIREGL